mmetsp:Transcript_12407/g.43194  ORF Transcript_12407/g.43194 Transcript_12407/m.43194 type:complete len:97 (-) Transcript_12407:624-914(-)
MCHAMRGGMIPTDSAVPLPDLKHLKGYLMVSKGLTLQEAEQHVKQLVPVSLPVISEFQSCPSYRHRRYAGSIERFLPNLNDLIEISNTRVSCRMGH